MTSVKMKASDTLHISSVRAENIAAGEAFDVPEYVAADLEKRKLASRVAAKSESAAPENKAVSAAPENKAVAAPRGRARKGKK